MAFQNTGFQGDAFQVGTGFPQTIRAGVFTAGPVYARAIVYQSVAQAPFVAPSETINADKWWRPLSEHQRRRVLPTAQQRHNIDLPFNEDTSTLVNKWHVPLREPVRLKKVSFFAQFEFRAVTEVVTVDKYHRPLSEPVRKAHPGTYRHDFNFEISFNEDTATLSQKWFRALSEPVRLKQIIPSAPALSWGYFAPVVEVVTLDKWWQALSEPPRVRPSLLAASQQDVIDVPFVENVGMFSKWWQPLSEPPRKPTMARFDRILFWDTFTPAPTEVITLDKYWRQLSEPAWQKKQLSAAAQQWLAFVKAAPFEETVYPDKYWVDLSRPARGRRLPIAPHPSFVSTLVEDSTLVGKWWRPLSEPVRFKRIHASHQRYAFEVSRQPDVSQATWYVTLSEPVRPNRPARIYLPYSSGQYFAEPELVTLDKWFHPLSEPARSNTFPTALQSFLFWIGRRIELVVPPAQPKAVDCIRAAPTSVRFTYSDRRVPDSRRRRSN